MAPVIKKKAQKSSKNDNVASKQEAVSGQLQKKINKKQAAKDERGVVFIKHLPHGFFEEQLKKYFEQFGKVTQLRLARSKKNGGSKGYAFVEFEYPEVAQVAAETMDNYLMFQKVVKAAYIPPEKQQYNFFKSTLRAVKNKSGKTVWVSSKTAALQRKIKQHNDWSDDNFQKRASKQVKKLRKLSKKYAHLDIDINKIINAGSAANVKQNKLEDAGTSKNANKKERTNTQKNTKKHPKLEDLLGNTLQEDSEDEDYIAVGEESNESIEEEASSDEESYGFMNDAEEEDESDEEADEDEESAEEELEIPAKKIKASFSKSLKSSNIERFDHMLKRKPQTGAVQKTKKKIVKQAPTVKAKNKMQLSQAKEVAKPLRKIKKSNRK